MTAPPDRRHEEETAGFFFGRRKYSLSQMGNGLLLFSAVVGLAIGCWSAAASLLGRRLVDNNAEHWAEAARFDTASMVDRRDIHNDVRALDARLIRVEEAVTMLTELKCRELQRENAPYLPPACTDILRRARQ